MLSHFMYIPIRYIKLFSFIIVILNLSAISLVADDLKVEEFNATVLRNDVVYDDSQQVGYLINSDDMKIRVHLKSSWDGDSKPNIVPRTEISFYALLSAVGSDGSVSNISQFTVYKDELAVFIRGNLTDEEKNIDIPIASDSGFHEWVLARLANHDSISFHILLDSSDGVSEDDEGNNEDSVSAALMIPITGKVNFTSNLDVNITSLTTMHEGGSGCQFVLNGLGTWQPGNGWTTANISFVTTCVNHLNNGDLDAIDAVIADTTSGTLGDRDVTVAQTLLTPSSGAQANVPVFVLLPEGYTCHYADTAGNPISRGSTKVLMLMYNSAVEDYNNLVLLNNDKVFLHVRGLPFYYNAYEIVLDDSEGLHGNTYGVHYVYDFEFASTDLRKYIGVQSNDIHFSHSSTDSIAFHLDHNGITLDTPLIFNDGDGWTHFPQTEKTWNNFEVSVIQDSLVSTLPQEHRFKMFSGCGECSNSNLLGNPSIFETASDYLQLGEDGSVMGRVGLNHSDLAHWGLFDIAHGYSFSKNDTNKNAMLYLPGYQAVGSGGVSDTPVLEYLLGTRDVKIVGENRLAADHLYQFDTTTTQAGNYFFSGLTVGPQMYRASNNQPEIGEGSDLSGNILRVAFGGPSSNSHFYDIAGNIANKYVLRPAGMTGVFNTDAVPGPNIYGFDINLDRFAFTLVNNVIDPYTWIDGDFHVGGKGDFSVQFDSMRLKCSGHVDGAHVVRHENDNERFLAWQTPIEVLAMNFKPNDPSLDMCVDQGRKLLIGNTAKLFALDEKLGMQANWSASGEPSNVEITGKTGLVLDRPDVSPSSSEYYGFNMALNKDMAMKTPSGLQTDGWFELNAKVSVPFWESPDVNVRVANKTTSAPNQSIVRPTGVDLSGIDNSKNNSELASLMKKDGKSLNSKYVWGNTGFSINLPVFYDSGRFDAQQHPQFIGHSKSDKYVIFEVNSGIDYIDPKATKVSFGASADFEKIRALNVDLHVDVSDPKSVTSIDNFLCSINSSLCSHPVAGVIGSTRSTLEQLNVVGSSGMEHFIETAVYDAVDQSVAGLSVNPFEQTSQTLLEVYSLPEKTASIIIDTMQDSTSGILSPLSLQLENNVSDIYHNAPAMLFNVSANQVQLHRYSDDLTAILTQLSAIDSKAKISTQEIENAKSHLETLVNDFTAQSDASESAINQIISHLQSGIDTSCTSMNDMSQNPLLHQVFGVRSRILMLLQALDTINLSAYGTQLGSIVGVDIDGITAAQEDIKLHAQEMLNQLNSITTQLNSALSCSSNDYSTMLNGALSKLTDMKVALGSTKNALEAFQEQMNNKSIPGGSSDGGYFGRFKRELLSVDSNVSAISQTVKEFKDMLDHVRANSGDFIGKYTGVTQASEVQTIMNTQMQTLSGEYAWISANGDSFVKQLRQKLRTPIDTIIAQSSQLLVSKLNGVTTSFPKYSADQLKWMVVDLIMNTPVVENTNKIAYMHLSELIESSNDVSEMAFDQVNHVIQNSLEAVNNKVNETIADATGKISGSIPLKSAKVDGYAKIAGNDLERLHIGAEWSMQGDSSESTSTYNAALDITSWNSNGKGSACASGEDANSSFDAIISVGGLPISIGGSDATIRKLYIGFMLEHMDTKGVFGGISLDGTLDFQAFSLYDIAFACGVGKYENYLGASAGAFFDDIQMKVAFLVGKTCNAEVLTTLDPQVAEFIELPNNVFNGVYVRGSASIPVWDNGCALTVGVSADAGGWFLLGPPITIGGLVGGGAYGKALCIASLRGQVTAYAQKSGDSYSFGGEGFGVAGIGFDCDPATWTSVSRSRNDSWCGTGDASFKAIFKSGWSVKDLSTSAIH